MKKLFISIVVITGILSCNKKKDTTGTTPCTVTIPAIAGSYKLTKLETVSFDNKTIQDITSTLSSCDLSGIYFFNADSTATYSAAAACSGNSSGTWRLGGVTGFFTSFNPGNKGIGTTATLISSWDCTNLQLMTMYPTVAFNHRFTLTRL